MKQEYVINNTKYVLELVQDECPISPREDPSAEISMMVCFHKRYNIGDEHSYTPDDFKGWEDMGKQLTKEHRPLAILPVYLYDHSGLTIATKPFGCHWDSGQIGYIFVSRDTYLTNFGNGTNRITRSMRAHAARIIKGDIDVYDKYITGDVWGFNLTITTPDGKETEDSCGGFYGSDIIENGVIDHLPQELVQHIKKQNTATANRAVTA